MGRSLPGYLAPSWPFGLSYDLEPRPATGAQVLPALGRPDPRQSWSAWREVAEFRPAQPPLSDCPLLAAAGLLCIANALVKEAAALSERGLINFGFVFPILQVQLPSSSMRAAELPSCTP